MRNIFATLIIAGLSFASCKKESGQQTDANIIGQWKWMVQYRGAPSNTLTPQNTGIEERLVLNSDDSWSVIQNGNLVNSGTFTTSLETNSRADKINSIHYRSQNTTADSIGYYKIFNDTLMFSNDLMGSVGGGARYYVK